MQPPETGLTFGSQVGAWRIEGELHRNSDSVTYAARNALTGIPAALEVISAPPLACGYTDRLRSVMHGLSRITHRGALLMFDVGTLKDGRPYVVREPLEGVTLAERLKTDPPVPTDAALATLRAICAVLVATHAAGVVHRDLVLDNVLLDKGSSSVVKLIGWGMTSVIEDEARRWGKLPGAAPARTTRQLSPTMDVYAFGVIVHQLLDPIPPGLEELWTAMMSEDPTARPTMAAVAKRLATVQLVEPRHEKSGPLPTATPVFAPRSEEDRIRWRMPSRPSIVVGTCAAILLFVSNISGDHGAAPTRVAARDTTTIVSSAAVSTVPSQPLVSTVPPQPMAPSVSSQPVVSTLVAQPTATVAAIQPTATVASRPAAASPQIRAETVERPKIAKTVAVAAAPRIDHGLMRQYQRVGHNLHMLQRQVGPGAMSSLWSRFRSVRIDAAMATVGSRQRAASVLVEIETEIAQRR